MVTLVSARQEFNRLRRDRLIKQFGGRCVSCGSTNDLQFHHLIPTEVNGRGRGTQARLKDIESHTDSYTLLCGVCHDIAHDYKRH